VTTGTTSKSIAPTETTLTTQVMEVDVDTANEWLATMAPNRRLSRGNLEALVLAMEEGRWHDDGSPIRFNRSGELVDGQHRLTAVVVTGKPQTFLVVWGVPNQAMSTLDTGKSRSRGDVLLIHDPSIVNVTNAAASTGMMLRWSRGLRNHYLRTAPVSNDAVIAFYDEHREEIMAAGRHGQRLAKATGAGSSMAFGLCFWLFNQINTEDAEFFWDRLVDGSGLEVGNPIYALRELLAREARSTTRERLRADVIVALIIKAWNFYRRGDEIRVLAFKVGGAHPEKFPEPV
jgi:hypothetical protein